MVLKAKNVKVFRKLFVVSFSALVAATFFGCQYAEAAIIGDLTHNNCVDQEDLALLVNVFGGTTGEGDLVADGKINAKDLSIMMQHWREGCGTTPQTLSPFGLEYGLSYQGITSPPQSSFWTTTGATWMKINDVKWGDIEPNAPVGGVHTYSWNLLDNGISRATDIFNQPFPNWDEHFDMIMVVRSVSLWGMKPYATPPVGLLKPGRPPKDENLGDYAAWVGALVERYDDDGIADAPGLSRPVNVFEIESEGGPTSDNIFYYATAEEYTTQLAAAANAARQANPNAKIMINGFNFSDLYATGMTDEQLDAHIATFDYQDSIFHVSRIYETTAWYQDILRQGKGYYDIVENHENASWRQMKGNAARIRKELANAGISTGAVQVWAGDTLSAPLLTYLSGLEMNPAFGTSLSVDGVPNNAFSKNLKLLNIMGTNTTTYNTLYTAVSSASDPKHDQYNRWYRKLQAEEVVKKFVAGIDAGYSLLNMGFLENWPASTGFPEEGFLDPDGTKRPMFYTYQLVTQKMAGVQSVQRIDVAESQAYVYKIITTHGTLYAAWTDDGKQELPEEGTPRVVADIPSTATTSVTVTKTITDLGQTLPVVTTVPVVNGKASLTLTPTPVFIENTNL